MPAQAHALGAVDARAVVRRPTASAVPQADAFPRGAFVLSADANDTSRMRWSAFWLAVLVFAAGLGIGWVTWGRKGSGRAAARRR